MADGDVLSIVAGHQTFAAPSGGSGALADPGNVYPATPTAVDLGYRIKETISGEVRVFEVTTAGTTTDGATAIADFTENLTPLGVTAESEVQWTYLGIVGQLPWTVMPTTSLTQDGKGNVTVTSALTADDGESVLVLLTAAGPTQPLFEINSDGSGDYEFQDGEVGGPITFDYSSTDPAGIVVRIGTEGIEVPGVAVFANERSNLPGVWFEGLPSVDPLIAGQLYTDGVVSAGVPKALMVSGGPG